jgi:hypothetical protein
MKKIFTYLMFVFGTLSIINYAAYAHDAIDVTPATPHTAKSPLLNQPSGSAPQAASTGSLQQLSPFTDLPLSRASSPVPVISAESWWHLPRNIYRVVSGIFIVGGVVMFSAGLNMIANPPGGDLTSGLYVGGGSGLAFSGAFGFVGTCLF